MNRVVHFDEASARAVELAREFTSAGYDLVVIRDVLGRISLAVDDRTVGEEDGSQFNALVQRWASTLTAALGEHAGGRAVIRASSMMRPDAAFVNPRARVVAPGATGEGDLRFLENTVSGADWSQVRPVEGDIAVPLVALYGFKGGVGRSTATALLARHLAEAGRTVLVVDLDLESPGVSSLLVKPERLPEHGVVDHIVEQAVDAHHDLDLVVRSDVVPERGSGAVWVAPARGAGLESNTWPNEYVAKLNRVYGGVGQADFADKLSAAIEATTVAVGEHGGKRPDVVLLDSRAGIHDIAAAVIARIAHLTLMFATNDAQTWLGYRDLFENWVRVGDAESVRDKVKIVATRVPSQPKERDEYLEKFLERSLDAFSVLYGDVEPGEVRVDVPADDDREAPHWPILLDFTFNLVNLDPERSRWHEDQAVLSAYREFLDGASAAIESLVEDV